MNKKARAAPPKRTQPTQINININITERARNVNGGKLTQRDRIIRHMLDYGSITSLEAVQEYGIMRLASRISDLKREGYDISKDMESGKNRYGETTH